MALSGHFGRSNVGIGKQTSSAVSRLGLEAQLQHFTSSEVISNVLNLPVTIIYLLLCNTALSLVGLKQ